MKIALVTTLPIDERNPMDSPFAQVRHPVRAAYHLGAHHRVTLIAPSYAGEHDHEINRQVRIVFLPTAGIGESTFTYAEAVHAFLVREPHDVAESFSQDAPLLVEQFMGSTPTVVRLGRTLLDNVACGYYPAPVNKPRAYREVADRQYAWSMHTREMTSVAQASLVVGYGAAFERSAKAIGQANIMQLPMGLSKVYEDSDEGGGVLVVTRQQDMLKGPDLAATLIKALPPDMDVTVIGDEKFEVPGADEGTGTRESVGCVSDIELHRLMENMSLVILPWRTTTFGLTALEAFAYGTAVAAYDMPEPLRHQWPLWSLGNWRDPRSSESAGKMIPLLDGEGSEKMREERLAFAKQFLWTELRPQYERAYELAIANAVGQGRTNKGW